MSDALVRDISDTALWVAYYRAQETDRPDALFRDPFARALAGERGEKIAKAQTFARQERLVVHGADGPVRPLHHRGRPRRRGSRRQPRGGPRHAPLPHGPAEDAAVGGSRSARHSRLQGARARRGRAGVRARARAARSVRPDGAARASSPASRRPRRAPWSSPRDCCSTCRPTKSRRWRATSRRCPSSTPGSPTSRRRGW